MQSDKSFFKRSLLFILIFLAGAASAQVYKWTDESGKTHFSDAPSRNHVVKEVSINVKSSSHAINSSNELADDKTAENVVMYATSWCPYCKKARKYFQDNGIPYTEYDIEKDARAKRMYDQLGGKGVPVILVGEKRMNGFNVSDLERIYK
jgi:glutaredoxin